MQLFCMLTTESWINTAQLAFTMNVTYKNASAETLQRSAKFYISDLTLEGPTGSFLTPGTL